MTQGPWRYSPPIEPCDGGPTYWAVVRDRELLPDKFLVASSAIRKAEELNTREVVREAAEDLLAACKAFTEWFRSSENSTAIETMACYRRAVDAIAKATPSPAKSNG